MLLNEKYYQDLLSKYQCVATLPTDFDDKTSALSIKIILNSLDQKKSVHVNFQGNKESIAKIQSHLFIELANRIFCNAADLGPRCIGDKVRSKKKYHLGKAHPVNVDFVIKRTIAKDYELRSDKHAMTIKVSLDGLIQDFIPISQNAHNRTIDRFLSYFDELNGKKLYDFPITYFERKTVFIAKKTFWDNLNIKNRVPTIYFPNPREESDRHEVKSIPALPDCLMFVTPKYEVCYDAILATKQKIDTIVLCDTEEDKIQQILQDKSRFGFNVAMLTNSFSPVKIEQIPCWNWYREETELLDSL
jgi:hypothetical protein